MLVQQNPPLHLTYGLNVHPGETWPEHFTAIRQSVLAVRDKVSGEDRFGLGLRLGHEAAMALSQPSALGTFKSFLAANNLYACTINGFPYGRFHGTRVKETVYSPDWRTAERRDYTFLLANILEAIMPEGEEGSISTVPVAFKPRIRTTYDVERVSAMLMDCVFYFNEIRKRSGRIIHLGLEPEPSCFLETTDETINFFADVLLGHGRDYLQQRLGSREDAVALIQRHMGVCFDTCHVAMQFEDLVEAWDSFLATGIRISQVQVSAALESDATQESLNALEAYVESVYLHQVRALCADGRALSWNDLPDALRELRHHNDVEQVRVHYHVPLFWAGSPPLGSTASELTPEFMARIQAGNVQHVQIETYTFDVLPPALKSTDVVDSIAREYEWLLSRLCA